MSVLRHRTGRFLVVVALLWVGWETYLAISARGRLDAALARELEQGALVNVVVTLKFAPEDFHIRIFQTHGIVSGVKGTAVRLNRVAPGDVKTMSRYYWIERIERS